MPFSALLAIGVLFLLVLAFGAIAMVAATDAWSLARRRYPGASDIERWSPEGGGEGSVESGAAFFKFVFASHRALGDAHIDRLCLRVRWAMFVQLAAGVALILVLQHA
jgi:hypothetical protein